MPEGPEVRITAEQLSAALTGAQLTGVTVVDPRLLEVPWDTVVGGSVTAVTRAGKWCVVEFSDVEPLALMVHMGISGRLALCPPQEPASRHVRFHATFSNGPMVEFVDPRKFGRVAVRPRGENPPGPVLGPDVFDASDQIASKLCGQRREAKGLLCDPSMLAGSGNYLADEALFRAGISPHARVLSEERAAQLADAVCDVAAASYTAGGHSMRDWWAPDGTRGRTGELLAVYRKAGAACGVCSTLLVASKVAGRTSTWCPSCQQP